MAGFGDIFDSDDLATAQPVVDNAQAIQALQNELATIGALPSVKYYNGENRNGGSLEQTFAGQWVLSQVQMFNQLAHNDDPELFVRMDSASVMVTRNAKIQMDVHMLVNGLSQYGRLMIGATINAVPVGARATTGQALSGYNNIYADGSIRETFYVNAMDTIGIQAFRSDNLPTSYWLRMNTANTSYCEITALKDNLP